jgi:hypothetical protein
MGSGGSPRRPDRRTVFGPPPVPVGDETPASEEPR